MDSFILHIDDIQKLNDHLSPEDIGKVILSLCSFVTGEEPCDMDAGVGIAYDFMKSRIQRDQEAYEKKAARNRINGKRHVARTDKEKSVTAPSVPIAFNVPPRMTYRSGNITHIESDGPNTTQRKPEEPNETETEPNRCFPISNPNPVSQKDICASGKPDAPSDVPEEDQGDHYSVGYSSNCSTSGSPSVAKKKTNTNAVAEILFEKLWKRYPLKRGKGNVSTTKKRALLEIGEEHMLRALQRYIDEHDAKERQGRFVPDWKNGDTFFNTGYIDYLDENYEAVPCDPPHPASPCSGFVNYEQSNTDWDSAFEQILLHQEEKSISKDE